MVTTTSPARPIAAGRARGAAPRAVVATIGVAWLLAVGARATGRAGALGHDHLLHTGRVPLGLAVGLFLCTWQVMVAAMMLPSALPMVRLFNSVASRQERPDGAVSAFLAGYAVVWTAFGAGAFVLDAALHRAVTATPGLAARPGLVSGAVLGLAGAFQFSELKEHCLHTCRHPAAWLLPRYRRGLAAAFRLGRGHGLFCVGCCWALMLVMFAAGVTDLVLMAALTAVMTYEKVGRESRLLTYLVGWTLLAWGAVTALASL
jgi:predicted metal-binding membrane protein